MAKPSFTPKTDIEVLATGYKTRKGALDAARKRFKDFDAEQRADEKWYITTSAANTPEHEPQPEPEPAPTPPLLNAADAGTVGLAVTSTSGADALGVTFVPARGREGPAYAHQYSGKSQVTNPVEFCRAFLAAPAATALSDKQVITALTGHGINVNTAATVVRKERHKNS